MAIWNRIISRKSVSSSSSAGENISVPTTPVTPAPPALASSSQSSDTPASPSSSPRSTKSAGRLAKTLSWRPKPAKEQQRPESIYVHPTERPLTEANLRHQELFSAFTFKFGRRKTSAGGRTNHSNISPGNSRPGSFDAGAHGSPFHHHHHRAPSHAEMDRRVSSLAGSPPKEQDGN
ncbi:hypothetical protein GQ53DRAFT_824058 [Thozetella sp. PMI_491]|nr:hypothetical protein GQ53DRAFT_824058 [Thozetella sp. PMI_491]